MKPFDIEAAKRGEPVRTLLGIPVKIICFDKKGPSPLIGVLVYEDDEGVCDFDLDGFLFWDRRESGTNLCMWEESDKGSWE